jgi:hypothetical protein
MTDGSSVGDTRTDLTDAERAILVDDRKRMAKLGTGTQLDEWLAFGPGLMIRRRIAMRIAQTNEPIGRRYTDAYVAQMTLDGLYDPTTTNVMKTTFTKVLRLYEEPRALDILAEIRRDMTPGQLARFNSPITAWQKVDKVLNPPAAANAKPRAKAAPKPASDLNRELEQVKARNSELVEELRSARDAQPADVPPPGQLTFTFELPTSGKITRKIIKRLASGLGERLSVDQRTALADALLMLPDETAPPKAKPRTVPVKVTYERHRITVPYTTTTPSTKAKRGTKKVAKPTTLTPEEEAAKRAARAARTAARIKAQLDALREVGGVPTVEEIVAGDVEGYVERITAEKVDKEADDEADDDETIPGEEQPPKDKKLH